MKRFASLLLLLCAALNAAPPALSYIDALPPAEVWRDHLVGDLMKFWDMPSALGSPVGAFPSVRCDDGSGVDYQRPCAEANNPYLLTRQRYIVSESRQVYAYGVAFHVTGDPKYLRYCKAGVDYIRQNFVDRKNGGIAINIDLATNKADTNPALRNAQELGYSLLGMAFYYYLTRDPEVLPDILAVKDYIFDKYYNPSLKAMQWTLANNGTARFDQLNLVAQLDQMNTYLVLLTPILPEPYQSQWKDSLRMLSHIIIDRFYSPSQNVVFLSANTPADTDITRSGTDFGHTAKAFWMIRWTGLLTGDSDLVAFAEDNGRRMLERAYLPDNGSWAEGLLVGGNVDINKSWWIYAELDQFAGTLALMDPSTAWYLPQTSSYYLRYFIDRQYGEVWNGLDGKTNAPQKDLPKQWFWKNGYHSMEHAMVSYMTARSLKQEPLTLYYAFQGEVPPLQEIRPYFFTGAVDRIEKIAGDPVYAVTYNGIY